MFLRSVLYGLRLIWQDPELPTRIRIAGDAAELLLESKPGIAENEIKAYSVFYNYLEARIERGEMIENKQY